MALRKPDTSDRERFVARMLAWEERAKRVRRGSDNRSPLGSYAAARRALKGARSRCERARDKDFGRYGARGIRVCEQWRGPGGFDAFFAHIGQRPGPDYSLDRIDNSRDYEPGNVRWTTWIGQANNRCSSRRITWKGKTMTAAEWGRRLGVPRQQIINRANRGRPLDRGKRRLCRALSAAARGRGI